MAIDLESADELLTTTRAVRKRMDFDRPVDRAVIERCIEIALQAPSGSGAKDSAGFGDAYPHFVVVTDEKVRAGIGAIYRAAHHPYIDHHAEQDPEREAAGGFDLLRWHTDTIHQTPMLVLICLNGPVDKLSPGMQIGAWGSVLPAAWSFMLALRARGLGASWTTIHLAEHQEPMAELLGLPDHVSQAVLMPVAYYKGETFKPATRPPVSQVIHVDGW